MNFRPLPSLMAQMRRPARHLLLLLLAWCVAFQSTLWAMPADCESESVSAPHVETTGLARPHAGHHHVPGMAMTQAHDEMLVAQQAHPHPQHSTHLLSADCGCKCGGLHCGGSANVSATQSADQFSGARSVYIRAELPASPESGHGLDLIRPPSKS